MTVPVAAAQPGDVATFKNDIARSGLNLAESTLTPQNVSTATFGLLHTVMVDGHVDAQPLYLSQLRISGVAHNVAFVATEHGSVYAIDADTGTPIWQVSVLANGETPSDTHSCSQVTPEIGITSTPVIDRSAGPHGALYVVGMSIDKSANYHQRLHALDITTGAELFNGPAEISATAPNSAGTTEFAPGQYEERAALLLANGQIYTTWTSHCDFAPYSGWIIAYDQMTLAQSAVLNVGPNSGAAVANGTHFNMNGPSIWMSGDGPGADAQGNVYLLTSNGLFEPTLDANGFPNMGDFGNSFLKLATTTASLKVADYFAMSNEVIESAGDVDLGSGGEMLLPDLTDSNGNVKHLVVGAGKDSNIYLVDRDNMGKFDASQNMIWQEIDGVVPGNPPTTSNGVRSSPAWFNGTIYYGDSGGTLKAFSVTNAKLSTAPTSQSAASFAYPGASPVVSASGTTNGIVWAHENTVPAVLHAYDASNLAHELYNSNEASGGRDQFGPGNKFIAPTVAGGKVFVGTTNTLAIFGLLK
ncbi:MAG TPA: PQQ-binding-like beta-propeller repeat protein [Steroidobacteraceae bacterium]|nr:PQQ-binding-like beta-propeller repeat protein [Steroidobacteraceae bacterium]